MSYFEPGVLTEEQFVAEGARGRTLGPRVAYSLLDVGDSPSPMQVKVFEDICFTLRLSSGTFRTSFRHRFTDLNEVVGKVLQDRFAEDVPLVVQDRAVSHALTSTEWARQILQCFPKADFEASDLTLYLLELCAKDGNRYIAEPDGTFLQAILPPFAVSVANPESWRFPVHRLVSQIAKRKIQNLNLPREWYSSGDVGPHSLRRISFIHPEARTMMSGDSRFHVVRRSVFDSDEASCDVIRTMNILNTAYFSKDQLLGAVAALHKTLRQSGIWIVGRTMEDSFKNHATIFVKEPHGWRVVERLGDGSEIESLALSWSAKG